MSGARVSLDAGECAGFGNCAMTAPEVFGWDDEALIGTVLVDRVTGEQWERARDAEDVCPARAIRVRAD